MAKAQKATGTALTNWDDELARMAQSAVETEASAGGGNFFSLKGGILTFNDSPLPNNEMAVIVMDTIFENVFYAEKFDPNSPQSPTCYALGRDEKGMEPHKLVKEASKQQHEFCSGCPMNEWATADTGRGKACRNTRRLAMLPAGALEGNGFNPVDQDYLANASLAFMRLPVTSVKGYASYVKSVGNALKRPLMAVYTRVRVVPDAKSQFKVLFSAIKEVPRELLGTLMERHKEAQATIDFPYPPLTDEPAAPARGGQRRQVPAARPGAVGPKKRY